MVGGPSCGPQTSAPSDPGGEPFGTDRWSSRLTYCPRESGAVFVLEYVASALVLVLIDLAIRKALVEDPHRIKSAATGTWCVAVVMVMAVTTSKSATATSTTTVMAVVATADLRTISGSS